MPLPDQDSAAGHSFALEVDGTVIPQITEVSGLRLGQDVVEFKSSASDGEYVVRTLPGRPREGELTVVRPRDGGDSFESWIADVRAGRGAGGGSAAAVLVLDAEGTPVKRYKLLGATPKHLEVSTITSGGTGVLTEKLVLTYEAVEVE
ncbi:MULTISPECIES: phage tail protein [unclassified Plantactinospora]|uniref:phage tail protein n=1 Tax=unclassified Plantactinospora TaxID=2631981 RepID=UPI000D17389A|nr:MULTISPECIES: phage tail protein [unclassified Plantactinospora]AVT32766.1 phage tail protein [Plantactinospora sp. BC1]AVT37979.1 phage tail protein [Plantactinospora sp. BB1]